MAWEALRSNRKIEADGALSAPRGLTQDDTSLLVVLLDTNPYIWSQRKQKELEWSSVLEHVFNFMSAYRLLKHENRLAFISVHPGESKLLYPGSTDPTGTDMEDIKNEIVTQLNAHTRNEELLKSNSGWSPMLSGALSLALCYINRIQREEPLIRPRILVLHASPDVSNQYISIMNCIFSAQKKSILIDTCILGSNDSPFLQQASHLTGGIYLKPSQQKALLQYALTCYLPDPFARKFLSLPTLTRVDFRASCFCHKETIDMGFVCSVCLSIYCGITLVCQTCGTRLLQMGTAKKPLVKKALPAAPK
ncbi:hypothetical protein PROFUN_04737 [Planoprotostelium fungivorum]|uniref:General transcription factor IIH subunit 3 n=1 Tax=Planoprotostelium fungivorum TaxID=1890364 RepID=A0A2P6NFZ9_9EUKA|nr:hypothetical protein PROFUN_04737 [Planoprotostelium fungivorum]